MSIPLTPFYFIRHGETDGNVKRLYTGSLDIPLTEFGEQQARASIDLFQGEDIKHIVSSPLQRAKKTAEIIAAHFNKEVTVIDGLAEACWGIYEGKPTDHDKIIHNWLNGETPEGAESAYDFGNRVMVAINQALKDYPSPVLIVAHGGVYHELQRVLGWPHTKLKNCDPVFHAPPKHSSDNWVIQSLSEKKSSLK